MIRFVERLKKPEVLPKLCFVKSETDVISHAMFSTF